MREGDTVLRLKRFESAQRALKISVLETMIRDLDNAALDLAQQIASEEERTRVKDTRHVAYSTFATAVGGVSLAGTGSLLSASKMRWRPHYCHHLE